MSACMVTNTLTCLVPSCESMLYVMWDRCTILMIWNLWYRLQHVSPIQIAARVIEIIEDMEKQTPKLKAIVQHNKEEVLKVSECWEIKMQQGNREFFHVFNVLSKELAQRANQAATVPSSCQIHAVVFCLDGTFIHSAVCRRKTPVFYGWYSRCCERRVWRGKV